MTTERPSLLLMFNPMCNAQLANLAFLSIILMFDIQRGGGAKEAKGGGVGSLIL